eukprot:3446360-Pleurochrysis_carterae.AAC.1
MQRLEPATGYGTARRRSLFFFGCSGCGEPCRSRLRAAVVGTFSLLTSHLMRELELTLEEAERACGDGGRHGRQPHEPPSACLGEAEEEETPLCGLLSDGEGEDIVDLLALPFVLRFQRADHSALFEGGVPALARVLRRACRVRGGRRR